MAHLVSNTKKPLPVDNDVNITAENQKNINKFAIRNGWIEELTLELKEKKNHLKNLEDAESDIFLVDTSVPILVGESFVHFSQDDALEHLTTLKTKTQESISKLSSKITSVKSEMDALKAELYAKFGDSINLEGEEDE